ncbi:MAG TPA: SHOCT domain-containing protein [Acidimicrobiia bacterium]|nr:SHOCT domain-containing protein [Acidimicrobiia bacterium]
MGLLGGIAKTAVVAGTSQAVRGRVARRQAEKFADRDAQIAQTRGAGYARGAQSTRAAPPPPATVGGDPIIEQLKQLAGLRDQGILSDEEFEAQKARILAQ